MTKLIALQENPTLCTDFQTCPTTTPETPVTINEISLENIRALFQGNLPQYAQYIGWPTDQCTQLFSLLYPDPIWVKEYDPELPNEFALRNAAIFFRYLYDNGRSHFSLSPESEGGVQFTFHRYDSHRSTMYIYCDNEPDTNNQACSVYTINNGLRSQCVHADTPQELFEVLDQFFHTLSKGEFYE